VKIPENTIVAPTDTAMDLITWYNPEKCRRMHIELEADASTKRLTLWLKITLLY